MTKNQISKKIKDYMGCEKAKAPSVEKIGTTEPFAFSLMSVVRLKEGRQIVTSGGDK